MLLFAAIIVFVSAWGRQTSEPADASIDGRSVEIISDAALVSERPIYRHSVIAGGAYSSDELASAMQDEVVAGHYQGLVPDAVRAEIVTEDRLVHVSYRKDDRIYWTKSKVLLRQGETILTDGTSEIRARCGNRISEQPLSPVSETEPDPIEFDRLVDDRDALNPGAPVASMGAPGPQVSAQSSLTTAAPGTFAQGPGTSPGTGPLASGLFAGPIAIDPSQVHPLQALTPGDSFPEPNVDPPSVFPLPGVPPPGDPSPSPGDPSPTPGGTPPPPAPPSSDGPPPQAGPNPIPLPPGLFDPIPGLDTDPFPDLPDTPGSRFDPGPTPFGPPPGGDGTEVNWPYDSELPVEPVNPVPVPEPGTILLVGGGAAVALFRKLRARR